MLIWKTKRRINTVTEWNAVESDVDTHRGAHPAPSPSAPEMLIARDRLGGTCRRLCLNPVVVMESKQESRRSVEKDRWTEDRKGTGRVHRGRESWGGSKRERQGAEGVKGSG